MKKLIFSPPTLFLKFKDFQYTGDISEEQVNQLNDAGFFKDFLSLEENEENEKAFKLILFPEVANAEEHNKEVSSFDVILEQKDDFFTKDGCLYHKDVPGLSIPKALANLFKQLISDRDAESLVRWVNFWKWVSLNPSAESREDIYNYIVSNEIPVLMSGLMLTFRRVVSVRDQVKVDDQALLKFVNQTYLRLKTAKKGTNVDVYGYLILDQKTREEHNALPGQDLYFSLKPNIKGEDGQLMGKLKDLLNTKSQDVYFTDNHTKSMKYYLGVENRMDRDKVDPNRNNTCSSGYHVAGKGFAYSGFGDTPVACLINPMDVLVVYANDSGKTRVSAFTIVGILDKDAEWSNNKEILDCIETNTEEQIKRVNQLIKENDPNDSIKQQFLIKKQGIDTAHLPGFFELKAILSNV